MFKFGATRGAEIGLIPSASPQLRRSFLRKSCLWAFFTLVKPFVTPAKPCPGSRAAVSMALRNVCVQQLTNSLMSNLYVLLMLQPVRRMF